MEVYASVDGYFAFPVQTPSLASPLPAGNLRETLPTFERPEAVLQSSTARFPEGRARVGVETWLTFRAQGRRTSVPDLVPLPETEPASSLVYDL